MSTPGGLVDKQELIDAQLDTAHLGRVVNSKDASGNPIDTSTNRTGGVNKTLDALETEYLEAIQGAGGIPIGTWTAGVTTFNAYNEYAVYNGIPYKPRASTSLPYVAQGADPTVAPDDANVQPYQEITEAQVVAVVEATIPDYTDIVYKASGGNSAVENMIAGIPSRGGVGDFVSTGGTTWVITSDTTSIAIYDGLYVRAVTSPKLADWKDPLGNIERAEVQQAQDSSALSKLPLCVRGFGDISWTGVLFVDDWLEWHGSGRFEDTIKPVSILRSQIGGDAIIAKRDTTANLDHFLMQDLGINLGYSGPSSPSVDQLVSMIRITANNSNDRDITYLRCHFHDPAHECTVHNVATTAVGVSSGGTIDGVRMLFCSGDVTNLSLASRNANMFKTIHGSIDVPGPYGDYPISDVVSFGNTCRGMRTLADFKRGTIDFSHDKSSVTDMTDVASISVDGVKDGVIGASNTGRQTSDAVDTKNFYEIQGVDIDVLGGTWDADNGVGAVAALLVTDYIYPAETTATYTGNQSENVNVYKFTGKKITGHCVRMINTKNCSVENIIAEDCALDGVSFEFLSKLDMNGAAIIPSGNFVNKVRTIRSREQVGAQVNTDVRVGPEIYDENGEVKFESGIYDAASVAPFSLSYESKIINTNQDLLLFGQSAPQGYSLLGTPTLAEDTDRPLGVQFAISVGDTSSSQLQGLGVAGRVFIQSGDYLYFSLFTKRGTATESSILIQEYDSSDTFLTSNFINLNASASWSKRLRRFTPTDANCNNIAITLLPANQSSGSPTNVGSSSFAKFRISRELLD